MDDKLFGATLEQWLLAIAALLGGWLLKTLSWWFLKRMTHFAQKTDSEVDDIILHAVRIPVGWLCFFLGLWGALTILPLPSKPVDVDRFVFQFMKSATIFVGFWMFVRLVNGFGLAIERGARERSPGTAGFVPVARKTVIVIMWMIAVLMALQNLGYSVTSLLAGIGLGGMALALAAKDTLANMFGSLVIFIDRSFVVGDWVKVGGIEGIVEEVTLRVTRVRTFERTQITIPNSDLTTKPIENFTRMEKRRIKFSINVPYETPSEKVEEAVSRIRALLDANEYLGKELQQVYLSELGAASLSISVLCFTKTSDADEFMRIRHEVLLGVKREFETLGIQFALPLGTPPLK
ncbi:mechanosensitive ion channel family protein [bacterium]|nr:mechanosensitive ion channel family protein [bacterium]